MSIYNTHMTGNCADVCSLITGGGIINYNVMAMTYIFFWRHIKAQGVDRSTFAYKGWFQPYSVR